MDVDIANLALGFLGDQANVSSFDPPDGVQAEHCARFYPVARNAMLEMRDWRFARRTALLAPLSDNPTAWLHAYALPSDLLKARRVMGQGEKEQPDGKAPAHPRPFETDALALYCDVPQARLRYTFPQEDTARFSPLSRVALAWLLASYLAGPIVGGDAGVKAGQQAYEVFLQQLSFAGASDADQSSISLDHAAPWIGAR